ncbi:transcription elongation factor GreA [Candidatus Uhrbacteria bacterium]|nr:transcription elongation factor GreA [Candidatus Uhrbacteria bacterium]
MTHYLTREGYLKLKNELEYLKTVARKEVIERIANAKELGDLKENAEYAEAKDDQGMIESRILEVEETLKHSEIIDETKQAKQQFVGVGSTVVVSCNGRTCDYMIVGTDEADPGQSRISYESPLGRAFIHKRAGEKVMVKVPKGEFEYVIMEIK